MASLFWFSLFLLPLSGFWPFFFKPPLAPLGGVINNETDITIGSEYTTDSRSKGTDFEISSSSSQALKEVTTVNQDNDNSGQNRNNVPLPSDFITTAIALNPENITDVEKVIMSSTLHETEEDYSNQLKRYEIIVEDNHSDLNEDSRNITKNETDSETEADERFSYFEKNLGAEDQNIEKSTNLFVNVQKKETQDLEELKKISDIIDKTLKPSINTKTGEEYNRDDVYSTVLEESKLNSLANDVLVDHVLNLSGNSYEEDASFEMNQNVSDDRLGTTDTGDYATDELFTNVEEVYDCLENITCLSELYDYHSGIQFNETESLNEEITEKYNFDVHVQRLNDDNIHSTESSINNDTDHDYIKEMIPDSYDETFLYDEEATKDNITRLAETAQIISHEVPNY